MSVFIGNFLVEAISVAIAMDQCTKLLDGKFIVHGIILPLVQVIKKNKRSPEYFIFDALREGNRCTVVQEICSDGKVTSKYMALNGNMYSVEPDVKHNLKRPGFVFRIHPILIGRDEYAILVLYFPMTMRPVQLRKLPTFYNIDGVRDLFKRKHGDLPVYTDSRESTIIRQVIPETPTYATITSGAVVASVKTPEIIEDEDPDIQEAQEKIKELAALLETRKRENKKNKRLIELKREQERIEAELAKLELEV